MLREAASYRKSAIGHDAKVNVDDVSAEPTSADSCRPLPGAMFALCGLLDFCRLRCHALEFYINDAGALVERARAGSAFLRYPGSAWRKHRRDPEGLYPGDYLVPVGQALAAEHGDKLRATPAAHGCRSWRQVDRHDDGHDQGRSRGA